MNDWIPRPDLDAAAKLAKGTVECRHIVGGQIEYRLIHNAKVTVRLPMGDNRPGAFFEKEIQAIRDMAYKQPC